VDEEDDADFVLEGAASVEAAAAVVETRVFSPPRCWCLLVLLLLVVVVVPFLALVFTFLVVLLPSPLAADFLGDLGGDDDRDVVDADSCLLLLLLWWLRFFRGLRLRSLLDE